MVALRRAAFVLCFVGAASAAYVDFAGKHGEASLQSQLAGGGDDEAEVKRLTEALQHTDRSKVVSAVEDLVTILGKASGKLWYLGGTAKTAVAELTKLVRKSGGKRGATAAWALGEILGKASGDFPGLVEAVKEAVAALARSITKSSIVQAVSPLAAISKRFPDVGGAGRTVVLAFATALNNACKETKRKGHVPRPWANAMGEVANALDGILDAQGNFHDLGDAGAEAVAALTEVLTTRDAHDDEVWNVHGDAALALGKVLAKASGNFHDGDAVRKAVAALATHLEGCWGSQAAWALGEILGQGPGHAVVPVEAVEQAVAALADEVHTGGRGDDFVKENAAEALGKASGRIAKLGGAVETAVKGLVGVLSVGLDFEQEMAAWALGEILGKASGDFLGLGEAVKKAVAALTEASLRTDDWLYEERPAMALSSILRSSNTFVRLTAIDSLLRDGDATEREVAKLTGALSSSDRSVIKSAAEDLGDIFKAMGASCIRNDTVKKALAALVDAGCRSGNVAVRVSVNHALGEILRLFSKKCKEVESAKKVLKHKGGQELVNESGDSAYRRAFGGTARD